MGKTATKAYEFSVSKLGCAYSQSRRWNTSPDIFDCSSLVYRAYQYAGYTFKSGSTSNTLVEDRSFLLLWPDSSGKLGKSFTSVAKQKANGYQPQKGDLIYICTQSNTQRANKITHVAIVESDSKMIHARGTNYGVVRTGIDLYGEKIVAITRFLESSTNGVTEAYFAKCTGNGVNLRKGPGSAYESMGKLNKNARMLALPATDSWCIVAAEISGKLVTGYMSKSYVNEE